MHRYAFSPKTVLRQILHWDLIKHYATANRLFVDLQCLEQDQADVDALWGAVEELPASVRTDIEQDLQDVYLLADEVGQRMIYEEALFRGEDLTGVLTELDSTYDVALWTLINREDLFAELLRFRASDRLNRRSWHIRRGVSDLEPETDKRAKDRLSLAITSYLVKREARGRYCHIDYLRRSTGHLFVAFSEDYPETIYEYDDANELARRKIRPTTDLLFFYSSETQRLEIFSHGGRKKIEDLQVIFAQTILGIGLGPEGRDGRTYDLNLLKRPDFAFLLDPMTGLEAIDVKTLHVRDRDTGQGMTWEIGGPAGNGVIARVERYFAAHPGENTDKYPIGLMDIDRAFLRARFRPIGRKRRGTSISFPLYPSGCLLDQEGLEGIVRRALLDSGIEQPAQDLVPV